MKNLVMLPLISLLSISGANAEEPYVGEDIIGKRADFREEAREIRRDRREIRDDRTLIKHLENVSV